MKLTKEQVIKEHRKMWNAIGAENLIRMSNNKDACYIKEDYFINFHKDNIPLNCCYACDYSLAHSGNCESCLIDWGTDPLLGEKTCMSYGSVYKQWLNCIVSDDIEGASLNAFKIANLPLKKDLNNIIKNKKEV